MAATCSTWWLVVLRERIWAYGVSAAVLLAVMIPGFRDPRDDGFPLSTYPMFSRGRKSPRTKVTHVVALTQDGRRLIPPPALVASEEVMQTLVSTRRAVATHRSDELCDHVARRMADNGARWNDVVEVQVRTDWYDAVRYFSDSRVPQRTKVHARCQLP